jgi:hypothetical protein
VHPPGAHACQHCTNKAAASSRTAAPEHDWRRRFFSIIPGEHTTIPDIIDSPRQAMIYHVGISTTTALTVGHIK